MTDNEFILFDRIQKIQSIIDKYGEENFYLSFSGGKDSTVVSVLLDMAVSGNNIPRVYANTGIELNMIRDFVFSLAEKDDRIKIIKPNIPIRKMLEEEGYPFKSKPHAHIVNLYQQGSQNKAILGYLGKRPETWHSRTCPKKLLYQFEEGSCNLRISDMCCVRLKEDPMIQWAKDNNKKYPIIGTMQADGGRRTKVQCLAFKNNKNKDLKSFQPLAPLSKEWEEWFITEHNVQICDIYKPPYNFIRTGCKGCPFARYLQKELDTLGEYFPEERKQCEIIWKPVYDEYRRLGYRLKDKGVNNE